MTRIACLRVYLCTCLPVYTHPHPQLLQHLPLRLPHTRFLLRIRVVVTEQMQHTMHNQQARFIFEGMTGGAGLRVSAGDGEEDIAQITATSFRVRFGSGEGEHVGGRVDSQIVPVEEVQLLVVGEDDGQVAVRGLMIQRGARGLLEQVEVEGEVEGGFEIDHFYL